MKKTFDWVIHFKKTYDVPDGQDPYEWFCENGLWQQDATIINEAEVEFNPDELNIEEE